MPYRYFISLIICVLAMGIACQPQPKRAGKAGSSPPSMSGKELYRTYCIACHGVNGKLAFNGAKDLTESSLALADRMHLISSGKGLMTPFHEIMTEEEIRRVAQYSLSFRSPTDD